MVRSRTPAPAPPQRPIFSVCSRRRESHAYLESWWKFYIFYAQVDGWRGSPAMHAFWVIWHLEFLKIIFAQSLFTLGVCLLLIQLLLHVKGARWDGRGAAGGWFKHGRADGASGGAGRSSPKRLIPSRLDFLWVEAGSRPGTEENV